MLFHSACTNLQPTTSTGGSLSHFLTTNHQYRRVPFPLPHQYLLFVALLIITILTDIRWYFIAILTYIYLMMNDIEHLFMCLGRLYVLGRMPLQVICQFLNQVVFF